MFAVFIRANNNSNVLSRFIPYLNPIIAISRSGLIQALVPCEIFFAFK